MPREVLRTSVTIEEKKAVKDFAEQMGLSEAALVRTALKKMGVPIEIEKARGAQLGNKNNPKGNPILYKSSPKYQKKSEKEK